MAGVLGVQGSNGQESVAVTEDGQSTPKVDPFLQYGGLALALLAALVKVWGLVDDRDTIVVAGLLLFAFGIVVSRLHGPFKVGPGGLEGNLPAARARALHEAIVRPLDELPVDDAMKSDLTDFLTWKALRGLEYESLVSRSRTIEAPAATATARPPAPAILPRIHQARVSIDTNESAVPRQDTTSVRTTEPGSPQTAPCTLARTVLVSGPTRSSFGRPAGVFVLRQQIG
jgi:hypothetical protein